MGTVELRLNVIGAGSNHNDSRDQRDQELWEDFCSNVTALASDDRYGVLALEVEC